MHSTRFSSFACACALLMAWGCSSTTGSPDDSGIPEGGAGAASAAGQSSGTAGATASGAGGALGAGAGGIVQSGAGTSGAATAGGAGMGGSAGSGGASGSGTGGGAGGAPTGFAHPGVLVNKGMLEFVKTRIAQAPWKSALSTASNDSHGKLSYTATKTATIACAPSSGPGSVGCNEEKSDADAAYTHALIWYYTGNQANAAKAIEIMDLYSSTTKAHTLDNAQLQSAWVAPVFARAAEIIRYSGAGWPEDKAKQFGAMLTNAYLPYIKDFSTRTGNWDASTIEAVMAIAVYNDDKTNFDRAVARWRLRVPAWAYLSKTDGAQPVQPPGGNVSIGGYWINPTKYVDGLAQETCKDQPGDGTGGMGHEQYGTAALINAAETARIQGVDLFSEQKERLITTLEFHAKYLNNRGSVKQPTGLCAAGINDLTHDAMWEIAYNAYGNVLGQALPETQKLVMANRPTGLDHHMVWETLTHGDIGAAGL